MQGTVLRRVACIKGQGSKLTRSRSYQGHLGLSEVRVGTLSVSEQRHTGAAARPELSCSSQQGVEA